MFYLFIYLFIITIAKQNFWPKLQFDQFKNFAFGSVSRQNALPPPPNLQRHFTSVAYSLAPPPQTHIHLLPKTSNPSPVVPLFLSMSAAMADCPRRSDAGASPERKMSLEFFSKFWDDVKVNTEEYTPSVLRRYAPGSKEIYGEINPVFVNDLIDVLAIRSHDIVYDLGSGVGNVVLQLACQTGCTAYGAFLNHCLQLAHFCFVLFCFLL